MFGHKVAVNGYTISRGVMLQGVLYLQLVTVQMQELQAVHAFGSELGRVLVHVHAHQPVTHLLIGPLRHGPVLPLVVLPRRDGILIQSLQAGDAHITPGKLEAPNGPLSI